MIPSQDKLLLDDDTIQAAYQWLCRARIYYPKSADIWWLRHKLSIPAQRKISPKGLATVRGWVCDSCFYLNPMQIVQTRSQGDQALWPAREALLLKLCELTLKQSHALPVSPFVTHIGQPAGYLQQERWTIKQASTSMPYVFRTDIQGYYNNIHKVKLLSWLDSYNLSPLVMKILTAFVLYQVEQNGQLLNEPKGIPRSSSLSPLLAAAHFYSLDEQLGRSPKLYYRRYMDDFLLLSSSRHRLRRAIASVKSTMEQWSHHLHPDKTVLGKTDKGFDWMGAWFDGNAWSGPSPRSQLRSQQKRLRLMQIYQGEELNQRLAKYDAGYQRWCKTLL